MQRVPVNGGKVCSVKRSASQEEMKCMAHFDLSVRAKISRGSPDAAGICLYDFGCDQICSQIWSVCRYSPSRCGCFSQAMLNQRPSGISDHFLCKETSAIQGILVRICQFIWTPIG